MNNQKLQQILIWIKAHKLSVILAIAVLFLLVKQNSRNSPIALRTSTDVYQTQESAAGYAMDSVGSSYTREMAKQAPAAGIMPPMFPSEESVNPQAVDRKIVRNSDVSLLVKNVRNSVDQIVQHATTVGGFMVNSSVSTPDQGGSGSLTIRVPSNQLDGTLQYLRGLSVKVVSENISGSDITDQFTDTEARLATLTKTKATFESMMDKAVNVDEILRVQQSIFQVQDQIDNLKGRLEYLKNTSQTSLISIYLSTDELALPYSPSEPWRPSVVFKTAVRSLLSHLRNLGDLAIWGIVYSPILLVIIFIGLIMKRKMK